MNFRYLMAAAALSAIGSSAGRADEAATVILPVQVVSAVAQYLAHRPFEEVEQFIVAIRACVAIQVPNAQGVTISHGECPAVAAALAPKPTAPAHDAPKPADGTANLAPPDVAPK